MLSVVRKKELRALQFRQTSIIHNNNFFVKIKTNLFRRSSRYNSAFKGDLLTGKKGTLILFDSSGLHRGVPLTLGERWAITRYYFNNTIPENVKVLIK